MNLDDPRTKSFAAFLCAKLIPNFASLSKPEAKAAYLEFAPILLPTLSAIPEDAREGQDLSGGQWREAAETSTVLMLQDRLLAEGQDPELAYEVLQMDQIATVEEALRSTGRIFMELWPEFELRSLAMDFDEVNIDDEVRRLVEAQDDTQ